VSFRFPRSGPLLSVARYRYRLGSRVRAALAIISESVAARQPRVLNKQSHGSISRIGDRPRNLPLTSGPLRAAHDRHLPAPAGGASKCAAFRVNARQPVAQPADILNRSAYIDSLAAYTRGNPRTGHCRDIPAARTRSRAPPAQRSGMPFARNKVSKPRRGTPRPCPHLAETRVSVLGKESRCQSEPSRFPARATTRAPSTRMMNRVLFEVF